MKYPHPGSIASFWRITSSHYGCCLALAGWSALILAAPLHGQWDGAVAVTAQWFESRAVGQPSTLETALTVRGRFHQDWDQRRMSLTVEPFLRWDPKGERTLLDLREAAWRYRGESWDAAFGIGEVFWGVTESRHLVDVINQREPIVSGPGYQKLGQPLVSLATHQDWGSVELLFMPYFRPRSHSGNAGLLWTPGRVVDTVAGVWCADWAARWSDRLGAFDLGFIQFVGTDREPRFETERDLVGATTLTPYYERLAQTGANIQLLVGRWTWKLEAVTLDPEGGRYVAVAGGLEYTFADYFSVFGEYVFDSRGNEATTSFNHDLFTGALLWWQDGQVQAGAFVDGKTLNSVLSLSASWRFTNAAVLTLEGGSFIGRDDLEPRHAPRQHTYLSLTLARYL